MHEVALAEDLISLLNRELEERELSPEGVRITINVEVGEMSCVFIDSFKFAFQAVSQGTAFEGAEISCEKQSLEIKCENCNFEGEIEGEIPLCPKCESGQTEVIAGEDFLLKSIEMGE